MGCCFASRSLCSLGFSYECVELGGCHSSMRYATIFVYTIIKKRSVTMEKLFWGAVLAVLLFFGWGGTEGIKQMFDFSCPATRYVPR